MLLLLYYGLGLAAALQILQLPEVKNILHFNRHRPKKAKNRIHRA
jgi:hypothetical protein